MSHLGVGFLVVHQASSFTASDESIDKADSCFKSVVLYVLKNVLLTRNSIKKVLTNRMLLVCVTMCHIVTTIETKTTGASLVLMIQKQYTCIHSCRARVNRCAII